MSSFASRLTQSATWEDVVELVGSKAPESQHLEFKREVPHVKAPGETLRKDAVALANGGGGALVFGVEEEEGHAAKLAPLAEVQKEVVRIRDVLSTLIEPPLRHEVFSIAGPGQTGILVVRVREGLLHAICPTKEASPEYWIRRDCSVRPMTPMEVSRRAAATEDRIRTEEHLAALAIWELRGVTRPAHEAFAEREDEFQRYFKQTRSVLDRSSDDPRVLEELGYLWEKSFTDVVRFGGFLQNFRIAASHFRDLLRPLSGSPDDARSADERAAWASFDRFIELGFAFSYEGNRRLKNAELLVALGADMLGEAVEYAEVMEAPLASRRALDRLEDQAQFYAGEVGDCFSFAREHALWRGGGDTPCEPPLLVEAKNEAFNPFIARYRRSPPMAQPRPTGKSTPKPRRRALRKAVARQR